MTRAAIWLLTAGLLLFVAVLVSQGLTAVFATLAVAGWGLLLLALLHLVPLGLDAGSIRVLFEPHRLPRPVAATVLARWVGESANSFLPAGPIGGPVVMARHLAMRGMPISEAAACVTVSTTLQALAQVVFALMGVLVLGAQASSMARHAVWLPLSLAGGVLVFCLTGFYWTQRRGLYGKLMRAAARLAGRSDWSQWVDQAHSIDAAVQKAYARRGPAVVSFALSLVGWIVGTAEVYLVLLLLRSPVGWGDALLLESLGQAIRAAGFAIPGSLGVQEGGYLLLAPLAGLRPETALALSLAKRAREVVLGVPGLLYLHWSERGLRRRLAI
ncbi:MAG TPA: lysylphosphatidylglycerol synthase domain-containing protein [Steroidobacteraceae bacterium]|nr:lysylphosphatidylglycerol synthase domain-containing protein [Steroidobacteraceae bacterium]